LKLGGTFRPEGELGPKERPAQRQEIATKQGEIIQKMAARGVSTFRKFESVPFLMMEVNEAAMEDLLSDPDITHIEEDVAVPPLLPQSVPLIGADNAWALGYSGSSQTIAVLDTGVDKVHPFLTGKVVSEACYSTTSVSYGSTTLCPDGSQEQVGAGSGVNCATTIAGCDHGTHVAGIAAGNGTGAGVAFSGVAKDADLISIQVFSQFNGSNCNPYPSPCILSFTSDQIRGLEQVYTLSSHYPIVAVNMSLGGGKYTVSCDSDSRKAMIDTLRSVGIATVIAAGNDGLLDGLAAPACISSAISVGATTKSDGPAAYSDSAPFLSLLAPGGNASGGSGDIFSSVPGGFAYKAGTSMAAPHVSGAWAVLKSKTPSATVGQILGVLTATGVSIPNALNGVTKSRIRVDLAVSTPIDTTPPGPPGGLIANAVSAAQIDISWTSASDYSGVAGYALERCQGAGCGGFNLIATLAATSYIDSNRSPNTHYTYRLRAFDTSGNFSGYSGAVQVLTPPSSANPMNEQCPNSSGCNELNIGGSASGSALINQVALDLLDPTPNLPIHYVNGPAASISPGNLHVWTGTRNGIPTVIRWAGTGPADGIVRLQQEVINPQSDMTYLDHTSLTACGPATLQTRASDGRRYYEISGCTSTVSKPVLLGSAEVAGSSLHQVGPLTTTVKPLDQSLLTSTGVAIVPWKFVVGSHVKKVDPSSGSLVTVAGLSRTEVEAILSRIVTDWRQLGLVTDLTTPGIPDPVSPVTLCLSTAGSASKAALDETVMKDSVEYPFGSTDLTNPASGVYFGSTTQDIVDCIGGNTGAGRPAHPSAIGYVGAEVSVPNGYGIKLNGLYANDPSMPDPKLNVKCGKYLYWTGERLNVRAAADPDISSDQSTLIQSFIADASNPVTIAMMPTGTTWVATSEMYVNKNADAGPISINPGAHPCAS
jgi:subtilisin family serine protease